jgi:nucleoside-diphosphate-sugar epimerase/predicted lipid carrier protein YhbT
MSNKAVFITGVTGALGSWIAQRAMADGVRVKALARATKSHTAQQRVEQSLAVTIAQPSPLLEVIEGDLFSARIDPGSVDLVIHCAACTAFHDHAAAASHETNVQGLRHILNLCTLHSLPLVHISTAYVCGNRPGLVLENELNVDQAFNNVYERTKNCGESLVHEWSAQTGFSAIVLRPGIVLGDWSQGRTARFNTLYHLMSALDAVGPSLQSQQLRIFGRPSVTKNIIPVDYFVDVAWHLIQRNKPGTYHITHPNPVTMGELRGIFNELFHTNIRLVADDESDGERETSTERMCRHIMAPYRSYMTEPEPAFDRSATLAVTGNELPQPPRLDLAYFKRLLDFGRGVNWGREVTSPQYPVESDSVREYFEVFLPDRVNQNLLAGLKQLTARFSISLTDRAASTWCLDIQGGVLASISRQGASSQCAFELDSPTFMEIAAARLQPQRAFFAGRVKIKGNIELGLKVATVLAKFFAECPFVTQAA